MQNISTNFDRERERDSQVMETITEISSCIFAPSILNLVITPVTVGEVKAHRNHEHTA